MKIKININKTIEQNASEYYEKVKKLKRKLEGATKALDRSKLKLDKLKKKEIKIKKQTKKQTKTKPVKHEWFEKFHWFISSSGLLVIGGKDATSNEIVVKKHTDKQDLVFHTEMSGSPFFVIKYKDKKIDEKTIKETAQATISYSKAWKLGLSIGDVFYVKPEQVTKEAKSGEFVARGAFMVYGKKEFLRPKLEIAIGIKDNQIIGGPLSAIKKQTKDYVVVVPGKHKKSDISKKIKKKIGGTLDEISRFLPAGGCEIKK